MEKKENKFNSQEYLYEKVGECVAGIHFLKWMFGILATVIIALFSIVFQINSKVSRLYSHIDSALVENRSHNTNQSNAENRMIESKKPEPTRTKNNQRK